MDATTILSASGSTSASLKAALTAEYWRKLCPKLHVNDAGFIERMISHSIPVTAEDSRLAQVRNDLVEHGFSKLNIKDLGLENIGLSMSDLGNAVLQLEKNGWPATFLNIYDEAFVLVSLLGQVISDVPCFDMLSWCIYPGIGGFSPHRDRQPDDAASTFHETGMPKYATCWLALTDATPFNSCMHYIPAEIDPGYKDGDTDEDPLRRALSTKESYQHIRSVPCLAGECVLFSHRVIHWGSQDNPPRIAFSTAYAHDSFEPSYFSVSNMPNPSLDLRLALSGGQMIVYSDRFQLGTQVLRHYYRMFELGSSLMHQTYVTKIVQEYASAVTRASAIERALANKNEDDGEDMDDDEEVEFALEQLLVHDVGEDEFEESEDASETSTKPEKSEGKTSMKRSRDEIDEDLKSQSLDTQVQSLLQTWGLTKEQMDAMMPDDDGSSDDANAHPIQANNTKLAAAKQPAQKRRRPN